MGSYTNPAFFFYLYRTYETNGILLVYLWMTSCQLYCASMFLTRFIHVFVRYELKSTQFHYEAHKNNRVVGALTTTLATSPSSSSLINSDGSCADGSRPSRRSSGLSSLVTRFTADLWVHCMCSTEGLHILCSASAPTCAQRTSRWPAILDFSATRTNCGTPRSSLSYLDSFDCRADSYSLSSNSQYLNEWMFLLPCDQKLAESQFSPPTHEKKLNQNAEQYGVRGGNPVEVQWAVRWVFLSWPVCAHQNYQIFLSDSLPLRYHMCLHANFHY